MHEKEDKMMNNPSSSQLCGEGDEHGAIIGGSGSPSRVRTKTHEKLPLVDEAADRKLIAGISYNVPHER